MPWKNHKKSLEYWRKRRLENPEMDKKYYLSNRKKILERHKRYYKENKEKINTRVRINQIARVIPLKKSCEFCKSKVNLDRHHPNYLEPLKIITLCRSCHMLLHEGMEREGSDK